MNTFTKYPILAGTSDPRVRRTLTPRQIMITRGDVRGEESLLTVLPPQVMLWTPGACLLRNAAEGENAGVLVDFGTAGRRAVILGTGSSNCDPVPPKSRTRKMENGRAAVCVRTGEGTTRIVVHGDRLGWASLEL